MMQLIMDSAEKLSNHLKVPTGCLRQIREHQYSCLVSEEWLRHIISGRYTPPSTEVYRNVSELDPVHLVAESTTRLPSGWTRVLVQVLDKLDTDVNSLVDRPLCGSTVLMTQMEMMQRTADRIHLHMWLEARKQYSNAIWPVDENQPGLPRKKLAVVIREILKKLYRCPIIVTTMIGPAKPEAQYGCGSHSGSAHPGLLNPYAILEFDSAFYIVFPFERHTLWDCLTFSPAKVHGKPNLQLFVLYQIMQTMHCCHENSVSLGNIQLHDFYIDDRCWVKLSHSAMSEHLSCQNSECPPTKQCNTHIHSGSSPKTGDDTKTTEGPPATVGCSPQCHTSVSCLSDTSTPVALPSLVQKWMLGQLSNFDYLMALNHLAGRRMYDPNHHPIMPWVMDLKSSEGSLRDLTKSKYRLNKGDHQLDVTYNPEDPHKDPLQVPHHIAEVLSDITYYVYKARRIPKSVLCTHVRQRWVPHEYPASMERLQEWTPDECIPEFFCDPEIFVSIHDDMPDLEIPTWADCPEVFIQKHRQVLEGDYVSQRLHHWIDLTFGHKLSGQAAIKAQNVCLQLADQHTNLLNHGVVQLFNHPHPPRVVPKQASRSLGYSQIKPKLTKKFDADENIFDDNKFNGAKSYPKSPTESLVDSVNKTRGPVEGAAGNTESQIILPNGFQPVAALNHLEALYEFSGRVAGQLPEELKNQVLPEMSPQQTLVARDMQVLGCLLVELFLSPHTHSLGQDASLVQRYILARSICQTYGQELPRAVRNASEILLRLNKPWSSEQIDRFGSLFRYAAMSEGGLPPPDMDQLLHPGFSVIPFPAYFRSLYWVLHRFHALEDQEKIIDQKDINILDKIRQLKKISKQKVSILGHYLHKASKQLGTQGMAVLIPYVTQLVGTQLTGVQAAWTLFNYVAQALGPAETETHFLKLLQNLFDSENTTPKFIKIYHRNFVLQLMVRFGLGSFLQNFVSCLIEATGRYKNFAEEDLINRQISKESALGKNQGASQGLTENGVFETEKGQVSIDSVEDALLYLDEDEEDLETSNILDEVFEDGLLLSTEDTEPIPVLTADDSSLQSADTVQMDDANGSRDDPDRDVLDRSSTSTDPAEDLLGKSLGRMSVHSVSRLIASDGEMGDGTSEGDDSTDSVEPQEEEDLLNTTDEGDDSTTHRQTVQVERSTSKTSGSADDNSDNNGQLPPRPLTPPVPSMVRSETDDFTTILSSGHNFNISDVASETIKWLAHRLGPVLTAKHLSRNLLRMLMLCYMGQEQLQSIEREGDYISTSDCHLVGDVHAAEVLECLSFIVVLYGEQVVLLQYFQHVRELIQAAVKKLSVRTEAGLISCVSLLVHIIPYLSDATLMTVLQDTIFGEITLQIMKLVSSTFISFPSGSLSRAALCYKLVDVLYIISLRIGFEMTREHMTYMLQKLFAAFNRIYEDPPKFSQETEPAEEKLPVDVETDGAEADSSSGLYCELKLDTSTKEYEIGQPVTSTVHRHRRQGSLHSMLSPTVPDEGDDGEQEKTKDLIMQELKEVFTPALAHTAYIPFCKLAGGIYLEQNLINEELIRNLCMIHDQTLSQRQDQLHSTGGSTEQVSGPRSPRDENDLVSGGFGRNVSFPGNKIVIQEEKLDPNRGSYNACRRKSGDVLDSKLRSPEMKLHSQRHLKGNWLAYWEHEVGLSDRESAFNFKQIKLHTFTGHSSSVRAIHVLDNENSFVSASKDKTVKLWSLRNWGDGQAKELPKWTYKAHKKSVFAVTFLETSHHMASCDSNVHIWDPFMERTVAVVDSPKNCPITVMSAMPSPTPLLVTVTADSMIRFLDSRMGRFSHEYRSTTNSAGIIRCLTVGPNGKTVAVGYSTGVMATLDVRTGSIIASWKGHEGEILQIKSHSSGKMITSCFDQTMSVWNINGDRLGPLKGPTEPVHCAQFYRDTLISGTTGNKVGVHGSLEKSPSYTCSKLRTDVFRGVLTTMAVMPLNRNLLLGADNGEIRLVA